MFDSHHQGIKLLIVTGLYLNIGHVSDGLSHLTLLRPLLAGFGSLRTACIGRFCHFRLQHIKPNRVGV